MSKTTMGAAIGVVLAIMLIFGGWLGFFVTIVFGAIGGVVGAQLDHKIDLAELVSRTSGRGRA
ncbi:hypothetical protein [Corynebacterium aquatimens]|uniref:ABC-type uncharacterized transport system permease subunit n=1 Tax=Corynebacterium aquatimens TaxID=1190508 RepID=A0A931DYY7_9CORY|nr:hypothetical protein [Corynebacterium aquatimens]MBG6122987.1 ABC-type uncharacterized transport system permease subunit [Corynebacterium aquatimens]WJY66679.1 hypothetical protein CAQUA_09960 [Corynebacterium aquatimens]